MKAVGISCPRHPPDRHLRVWALVQMMSTWVIVLFWVNKLSDHATKLFLQAGFTVAMAASLFLFTLYVRVHK